MHSSRKLLQLASQKYTALKNLESLKMSGSIETIFLALTWLFFKHMIADYLLQKPYQFLNKGIYGHPGGLLHASIHVGLTIPIIFILPSPSIEMFIAILSGEFIAHYHIDWSKERIIKKFGWTPKDQGFWSLFGLDQFLHSLTYLIIIWIMIP